jgi:NAD(P)H-dependent FMN reductase
MSVYIPVLLGSRRIGRQSIGVARCLIGKLQAHASVRTEILDLATYNVPLMDQRLQEMPDPPADIRDLSDKLQQADGIVMVVPEYKNGYPGVLKNALDYLDAGLFRYKPIAISTVSSGEFGGLNCLAQLRLVCLALGGVPIPASLPVSQVQDTVDADGTVREPRLAKKVEPFLRELLWYVEAMVTQRHKTAWMMLTTGACLKTSTPSGDATR